MVIKRGIKYMARNPSWVLCVCVYIIGLKASVSVTVLTGNPGAITHTVWWQELLWCPDTPSWLMRPFSQLPLFPRTVTPGRSTATFLYHHPLALVRKCVCVDKEGKGCKRVHCEEIKLSVWGIASHERIDREIVFTLPACCLKKEKGLG